MQGKNERLRMRRERGLKKGGCFFRESQKCSSHESLSSFGARRFPKRRAKSPLVRPQTHTRCPGRGLTRRLRRERWACSPMGRSHFSFDGERKVCKRKPAARRLREKGSYCPFCRRGSLCRAHPNWQDFTCYRARSELAFFRRQNGRAFFPPLPIAALLPRSWRRAGLPLAGWDASLWPDCFAAQK